MRVKLSTRLRADPARIAAEVKTTRLLRHVAAPVLSFTPTGAPFPEVWGEGRWPVALKFFGLLPVGRQIVAVSFPTPPRQDAFLVRDAGSGDLAKVWDHLITIRPHPEGGTLYTDEVEVKAGLLTPFVWLFARAFYAWRQHRWRRLVARDFAYD